MPFDLSKKQWPFLSVAHRGYNAYYPENTIIAFDEALKEGANALEFDIRLTKDKVPVVFHDATLKRFGGSYKSISRYYWKDLKEIKLVNSGKKIHEGRIPKLDDIFTRYGGKCLFYIELKCSTLCSHQSMQELVDAVTSKVREFKLEHSCLLVSFNRSILEKFLSCCPNLHVGLNIRRQFPDKSHLQFMKNENIACCPHYKLLEKGNLEKALNFDLKLLPWVVNEQEEMRKLIDQNVTGITTDYIKRLTSITNKNP